MLLTKIGCVELGLVNRAKFHPVVMKNIQNLHTQIPSSLLCLWLCHTYSVEIENRRDKH